MTTNTKLYFFLLGGSRDHTLLRVSWNGAKQIRNSFRSIACGLSVALLTAAASAQSLQEALDNTLGWSSGGAASWYGQTSYTHDGVDAAWNDWIGDNQEAWIETTVQGPGTIWFWWKVSSETNFDFLTFTVDGQTNAAISGEVVWQRRTNYLAAGPHTLRWIYSKDKAYAAGLDRGFLDEVAFITPAAVIAAQPQDIRQSQGSTVLLSVAATGDLLTFQWRRDGTSLTGETNANLVLSNVLASQSGFYDVVVTNIYNAATSRLAKVDIYVPLPMPTRSTNVGVVVGWGNNNYGQLNVPADLTNAVAVAAGGLYFSLGLRSDGTVFAWGPGDHCQTCVPSDLSNVVAIAAGYYHSLALRADGTVAAWGNNWYCKTCVPADLSNVVAVAAGQEHSLALRDDGTVVAWGQNSYGQTTVPTNLNDVVGIAAGQFHSLALRRNGRVVAWGHNDFGQTNVPDFIDDIVTISAGSQSHGSFGLKRDGAVVVWGGSGTGETIIPPGLNSVSSVAVGGWFSAALKRNGTATTWGSSAPSVPPTYNNLLAVAAGGANVLAIVTIPLVGPSDMVVPEGATASFTVLPQEPGSFSCQWYFNGAELLGATNTALTLTNVSLVQAGSYSARIRSDQRQALSQPAKLVVTPRNDACSQRIVAGGGGGRFYSSTLNASSEVGEPNHANALGGRSIWYEWTAPMNGSVTVDTIGSTFDTVVAVYTGQGIGSLVLVAADDDGANFNRNSRLVFDCSAGVTYLIAVDGFLSATGGVILNITPLLSIPEAWATAEGSFNLGIFAPFEQNLIVEASTNLQNWVAISTNAAPAEGALRMSWPAAGNTMRFYRARLKTP